MNKLQATTSLEKALYAALKEIASMASLEQLSYELGFESYEYGEQLDLNYEAMLRIAKGASEGVRL